MRLWRYELHKTAPLTGLLLSGTNRNLLHRRRVPIAGVSGNSCGLPGHFAGLSFGAAAIALCG